MPYDPEKHNRRSIRLPDWDYRTPAVYFVTICALSEARKCPQGRTYKRVCLFGKIAEGCMFVNEYGRIVAEEWRRTERVRGNVQLDAFVVMPNRPKGDSWSEAE